MKGFTAHAATRHSSGHAVAAANREASIRYSQMHHLRPPAFLVARTGGTRAEISLEVMAYNLKRMLQLMGAAALKTALASI
jgi:hypothetical protein